MSRRLKIFCFVGITMAFAGLWGIKDTYAAPGKSELITKAYANGIGKCSNNAFFAPEISASSVRGFDSVIGNYGFGDIRNPNGLEGGSAGAINCGKLFSEHVSTSKFPSYSQENASAVNSALLDIGYKSNGASGGSENCINISYHITSDSSNAKKTTNSLCFNVGNDENRTISADEINGRNDIPSASGDGVSLGFGTCMNFPNYKCVLAYYGGEVHDAGSKQFTSSANWYDIVSDVKTAASDINKVVSANGGSFIYHDADTSETSSGGGSNNYIYDSSNNTANASKILNYLTSYGSWSNAAFNNTEQYWFYMYILTDYYGAKIDATNCSGSQSGNAVAVRNEKNERRYCAVSSATNTNAGEVNIFSAGGSHYLDRKGGFDDVLKALQNEVSAGSIPVNELYQVDEGNGTTTDPTTNPSTTNPTTPTDGESGNASDAEDVCYGSAGTLGMGWVLCPILSGTSNALNWVYDNIVKDYLEVKPGLVSNDDVYKNWQIFQNIANIIMVIFLLVVVFSQLTGIGIDNYGIKKILPRLIICAILINLSYFIVQFLVDVSNIVGASIAGIFQIQGSGVSADSYSGLDIPSNILGISIVTAFGTGVAAVVANPAILLSFLLVILSGLISVLMMWLILVARQAGVVIAVVIAPLAFVMYLLPNTSKFTKSWGNIVKGLLLLYPLAALLIGASFFASDLIASLGDNFALPAMLLRVVPFFALPSLFRKSIDAVGNIGTKIQGFGRSLGRGATGAIRGSDAFKNAQERGMERRTRIRAGLDRNGNEATGWRGLLRSRSARDRARYRSQYLKNQSDQNRADLLNDPDYIEAMRQKQAVQDQAERNEIALMNSEDYRNAVAAKQATDLEKRQTEAQASAITTGTFKRSDGADVNTSNLSSLARALQYEASQDDDKQDMSKIRALYDAILAKGDDGIDALAEVWDSGTLKGKGLQRITESIASDGTIKSKARSLHAVANDVMNSSSGVSYAAGQVANARTTGAYASKIKPEMLSNMTDNERNNYINYASKTGDSSAMQNIYAASQNINSFKPNERTAVYNIADRYVQDHMELAKAGTYTYKDYNGNTQTAQLRRDANNVLVMDTTRPDGTVDTSPIRADFFKSGDFRLKRN